MWNGEWRMSNSEFADWEFRLQAVSEDSRVNAELQTPPFAPAAIYQARSTGFAKGVNRA